ncbi:DUF1348 family protein [Mycobacterium lepromatosis]|nr:hypothetical protein MLPF_2928 [Mycobacterium lepromatosis]
MQLAKDVWNTRYLDQVSLGYVLDSQCRKPSEHIVGSDRAHGVSGLQNRTRTRLLVTQELWVLHANSEKSDAAFLVDDVPPSGVPIIAFDSIELDVAQMKPALTDVPLSEFERRYFGPCPASGRG